MTHRIIHFKQQALLDPETYQAMLADGVGHWEALVGKVVGIEDEKSHEFAADSTTLGHSAHDHLDTRSMLTWTPD
ncbi:hypothetical protein LER58_31910, partial [Pseudomonas aeruginosa]